MMEIASMGTAQRRIVTVRSLRPVMEAVGKLRGLSSSGKRGALSTGFLLESISEDSRRRMPGTAESRRCRSAIQPACGIGPAASESQVLCRQAILPRLRTLVPIELTDLYSRTRDARKVIVVALGFLGDSLHLIPALWEIKRNYPQAELHVAATPLGCEVFQLVPCVERSWPVERNSRQSNCRRDWQIVRAMRRERSDLAINLSSADRPVIWTALTGARQRVAHTGPRK